MPHLVEIRNEFPDVAVVGVTKAPVAGAEQFRAETGASYALLADGAAEFEKYGIGAVWSSPVYLIDPRGRIVAEGFDACAATLRARG